MYAIKCMCGFACSVYCFECLCLCVIFFFYCRLVVLSHTVLCICVVTVRFTMSSIHTKMVISDEVEDDLSEYKSDYWWIRVDDDCFRIMMYFTRKRVRRARSQRVPVATMPATMTSEVNKWKALMRKVAACEYNAIHLVGESAQDKKIFNDRYVPLFCDAIKSNTVVTTLEVWFDLLDDNGMRAVCEALQTQATITYVRFYCSYPPAQSVIGADLEKLITVNATIQTLKVDVTAEEVIFVARALPHNSTLTKLDLMGMRRHRMGDKGLRILCEGLKRNYSITDINLRDNKIGDEGTKDLVSL